MIAELMKTIKLFCLLVLIPAFCFCWNDSGHMTAGAVAYSYLKQNNPKVLKKVLATLRQHPWYAKTWTDKMAGLTPEQKDAALFMLASTWPDNARNDSIYGGPEHAKWHYINYPVAPPSQSTITIPSQQIPNAEERLDYLLAALKKQKKDTKEKAVNLSWLFHITEDVHQPLHTVALFDENHPSGDKGGNDTYIKLDSGQKAVKLHSYWDGLVTGTFNDIPAKADNLLALEKYKPANLPELLDMNHHNWITVEGVSMAKAIAYRNETINGTYDHPTYVDQTYISEAKTLGERRVVVAGIRLAKELIALYK
jgi:hypothetical protein